MAAGDISFGSRPGINSASLQPSQGKALYGGNYLNFTDSSINQWAQQFLPDVYEKEAEIYGNRTISSFLRMVSAEMPSTSDQIIWTEQGRLHTRYTGLQFAGTGTGAIATAAGDTTTTLTSNGVTGGLLLRFQLPAAAQPTAPGAITSATTEGGAGINFRIGQTVMIQKQTGGSQGRGTGTVIKGVITEVNAAAFKVSSYIVDTAYRIAAGDDFTALVYGSEFAKGTGNFTEKLDPSYSTYQNSPIIMKEHYSINGSDTSQIGWIEVSSENGASGYLWYIKSEHENRLRWEDYIEMSMVEGERQSGTGAALQGFRQDFGGGAAGALAGAGNSGQTARGTQGFFAALRERGNVYDDLASDLASTGTNGDPMNSAAGLALLSNSFDVILKQLDKQGSIEENMLYVNRDLALSFDNFLAQQNNYGATGGVSWGVFNNAKDMAIDLGFTGFRRGSYDFYKTDWKYLNDYSTRGGFGDIQGVMIPAGTSTVYDQNLGKNIKRPFLHVRYRSSDTENRKMKSWITGSVGGAYTTDVDEMRMHYLTERCLITQGANNFFLLEG